MTKINFIKPILTQKKLKKYNHESKNIEELINFIDEGSQKIFSFKIPKSSIYINMHDYEEFVAINLKTEYNNLLGYTTNEIGTFSENLEEIAYTLGYHSVIYKNEELSHLLNVVVPEFDSLEKYFRFVQIIAHEIGHATQQNYLNRKKLEAKKQITFAKDLNYVNDLIEKLRNISPEISKDVLLRIPEINKRLLNNLKKRKLIPELELSNQKKIKKENELKISLANYNIELEKELFNMRKDYFESIGEKTSEISMKFHKKKQKENQDYIDYLKKKETKYAEKAPINETIINLENAIKKLNQSHRDFLKKDSFNNFAISEGWAQYFSFKVMDYLIQETNFFGDKKPEIFEVKKELLKNTINEDSVYGNSTKLFQNFEEVGLTPYQIAQKVGISYNTYSKINSRWTILKNKLKFD